MDEMVLKALAKWPNVPHCYGWLGLDARGNWYMRDDRAQAAGAFASGKTGSKGSLLKHEKLIDFIQRNYAADTSGQWFFQNGPQRVYVELELTPWVWRLTDTVQPAESAPSGQCHIQIAAQDGQLTALKSCWLDENGYLYLHTQRGFGLVHTQDVGIAAEAVEAGLWRPQDVLSHNLQTQFGYVDSPAEHSMAK